MELEILFKALADLTRLRCLMLLLEYRELCVCELTEPLALAQPKVSRHLAALRTSNLVASRKHGLWVYYRINPDLPEWVGEILRTAHGGCRDTAPFARDRLQLLAARKQTNHCTPTCC